jgi:hypothetical protein
VSPIGDLYAIMKFLFLLLTFNAVLINQSDAQSFTLKEIESLTLKNLGEIEDILLKKGYEYDSYDSISKKTKYRYANTFVKRGQGSSFFYVQPSIDKSNFLTYVITDKSEYSKLKDSLSKNGYKFLGSDNKNGKMEHLYKSINFGASFSTQVVLDIEGESQNVYLVQIVKFPKS